MPDLMPDTSIYQHVGQGNQLDIGRLLGVAGAARQLQSQSAISQALKATVNPQTGQPDPTAALGALVKDPNVYLGPEDVAQFTHAQQAQSQQAQFYNEQIGKGAGALYAKAISKAGANESDFNTFATIARKMNVPASTLMDARKDIVRPDGSLDPTKLANWYSIISGGQQLPQQQYMTGQGRQETAPAATFMTGGPSGGGGGSTPGTATLSTPAGAAVGAGAGHDYRADSIAARNFQTDVTPLRHIIQGLQDGTITGRSTEEVQNLRNFLHTTGIDSMFGKDLSKETVPYEEMRKYMVRAADQASGGQTNDRLAAAVSGNPNMKLLSASNLDLAKVNLGLRRMQQVGYQEFQRELNSGGTFNGHPLQYEDYTNWYTQWAAKQDSRAFVHDLLSKDQRQKVFDSFKTDDEAKAYQASMRSMRVNHSEIERAGAP